MYYVIVNITYICCVVTRCMVLPTVANLKIASFGSFFDLRIQLAIFTTNSSVINRFAAMLIFTFLVTLVHRLCSYLYNRMVGKPSAYDLHLEVGLGFARQAYNEAFSSTAQQKTAKNDERHTMKTSECLKVCNANNTKQRSWQWHVLHYCKRFFKGITVWL